MPANTSIFRKVMSKKSLRPDINCQTGGRSDTETWARFEGSPKLEPICATRSMWRAQATFHNNLQGRSTTEVLGGVLFIYLFIDIYSFP
ncbi:hypothetical protein PAXRUDRAFT_302938 [Paxillus rubicundulus Ve08.2h10]|uniref:Uncharacterized protein n=1 Tax=Paxillus rubicundulus Ve08.2h10 TaxID=930991 RepID=A0A0D0ED01_9AGAM|nr:hypothetical protein PAXRUDRAFT_302938 [Paxillus rubicundulus Ve08.2h10]